MRAQNYQKIMEEMELENVAKQINSITWHWIAAKMNLPYPYSFENKVQILKKLKKKFDGDRSGCLSFLKSGLTAKQHERKAIEPNG